MTDPSNWRHLSPAFKAALRRYDHAAHARVLGMQKRNTITEPLYHYTDRGGLQGIITNGEFWFTHYRHLNDDEEILFGMGIAKAVLAEAVTRFPKAAILCEISTDILSAKNLDRVFEFYIGSFSRSRDDAHQWDKYGAQRQGFAIGLAPALFKIEEQRPERKPDSYVSYVRYGELPARAQHQPAIESAARIAAETADHKAAAMRDRNIGMLFFREFANRLVAAELILNSLTVKAAGWEPESEARLFILGERAKLAPCICTRPRGTKTVPFIKHRMPLRTPGSITEILIGPAAPADAEDFACFLLKPFHRDPRSIIRRSTISDSAL